MDSDEEVLQALLELKYIRREGMALFDKLEGILSHLGNSIHNRDSPPSLDEIWRMLNDSVYDLQDVLNVGDE